MKTIATLLALFGIALSSVGCGSASSDDASSDSDPAPAPDEQQTSHDTAVAEE